MSILHIQSFEIDGGEGFLAEIDCGTCAVTVFHAVDSAHEELACWAGTGDPVCFRDHSLEFDHWVGCVFRLPQRDVIDLPKHQNTIGAEIEVGVARPLFELVREHKGVGIIVPQSACLIEALKCFPLSNNDRWCVEPFWPSFG